MISLSDRRTQLDEKFLRRIEFGDYNLKLNDYISFNQTYDARHTTIRYSYFNRIPHEVKVYFSPSNNSTINTD